MASSQQHFSFIPLIVNIQKLIVEATDTDLFAIGNALLKSKEQGVQDSGLILLVAAHEKNPHHVEMARIVGVSLVLHGQETKHWHQALSIAKKILSSAMTIKDNVIAHYIFFQAYYRLKQYVNSKIHIDEVKRYAVYDEFAKSFFILEMMLKEKIIESMINSSLEKVSDKKTEQDNSVSDNPSNLREILLNIKKTFEDHSNQAINKSHLIKYCAKQLSTTAKTFDILLLELTKLSKLMELKKIKDKLQESKKEKRLSLFNQIAKKQSSLLPQAIEAQHILAALNLWGCGVSLNLKKAEEYLHYDTYGPTHSYKVTESHRVYHMYPEKNGTIRRWLNACLLDQQFRMASRKKIPAKQKKVTAQSPFEKGGKSSAFCETGGFSSAANPPAVQKAHVGPLLQRGLIGRAELLQKKLFDILAENAEEEAKTHTLKP